MPLHACPACACHVTEGTCVCPHCGASVCAKSGGLPAAALLMGLALAGCDEPPVAQPEYGVAFDSSVYVDQDGDGWTPADGDCNDDDETIHPEAEETPGDGVDSDCDDKDDT